MLTLGFEDIADFAYAYADASTSAKCLTKCQPKFGSHLALVITLTPYQRLAAVQDAWSCTPSHRVGHSGPPPAKSACIARHCMGRPPKLTPDLVQGLVDKFQKNYPGELLGPESMPSIRLLSRVYDMKTKHFKWIPWQLRLSSRQCQEAVEARTRKAIRTEAQLLTQAFFDDTPEISVDGGPLTAGWLHRIQAVFRNALALCQAVHLLNAKQSPGPASRTHVPHAARCGPFASSCMPIGKSGTRSST